jgi:hypothetical protein
MLFISDTFHRMVQVSKHYKSTFGIWKGPEFFVFIQDTKHIAVSCLAYF